MRNALYKITLLLLFAAGISFSQTKITIEEIKAKYESFKYRDVIRLADIFLFDNPGITKEDSIEVLTMKAVSYYSLNDEISAEKPLRQIIDLDRSYELNPRTVSPKIISLYEQLKVKYAPPSKEEEPKKSVEEMAEKPDYNLLISTKNDVYINTFARSVVFPGLGHLYLDKSTKGWVLTALTAITLPTMVYFIFDASLKEKDYLNEIEPALIELKYSEYNSAYKTRNLFIAAFAVVWLYTQIDLLFNSSEAFMEKIKTEFVVSPGFFSDLSYVVTFRVALPF
ncbi:MAG: hypothetical protein K8F36_15615 [Melioribacteraceae bacterium]|nr:hypothetical protein [Melioribacteraceae bacterium]MCO6474850.1 hypothetical protein [Melioribacteraceae bacterium]